MKILVSSFQVYDALGIFFELEKPPVEHFEGFILLPKEGGELQNFFKTFNRKLQFKNSKNSPIASTKVSTLMVGGMFAITTISC
jgi:hypothetical protein